MENLFDKLLSFYKTSCLTSNSRYFIYKEQAKSFKEKITEEESNQIYSSFDSNKTLENLKEITFDSEEEKYELILGVDNFVIAIKNLIDGYEPKFLKFNGLQRQSRPPNEVFDYVGH